LKWKIPNNFWGDILISKSACNVAFYFFAFICAMIRMFDKSSIWKSLAKKLLVSSGHWKGYWQIFLLSSEGDKKAPLEQCDVWDTADWAFHRDKVLCSARTFGSVV
jgi:hypothetical protein